MGIPKKQSKITQMFRKASKQKPTEDCEPLRNEIQDLEQKLAQMQNKYIQLKRNTFKRKVSFPKSKVEPFVRPERIVLTTAIDCLKKNLEVMSMLTGVEVKSFVLGEHCCVLFHMQHDSGHEVKHGLRIEMQSGSNVVSKSSLPLGFNINAVIDEFDNIMKPNCLESIRTALVAYYDRLNQFEALKNTLKMEGQTFKLLDSSYMEITFTVQSDMDPGAEEIQLVLVLEYRIYDIRPKQYTFKDLDVPDGTIEALKQQCLVFKRKPLNKAFKEAFITGVGPFKLVKRLGIELENLRKQKTFRPNKHNNYNNDDTFHPEDCSDQSEDGEVTDYDRRLN